MSKKNNNFFEEHIEKIVLAIVGLVCIFLLVFRVFIGPNKVLYEGKKHSPGDIDNYISKQAKDLEYKLKEGGLENKRVYKPKFNGPIGPNDPVRVDIRGELSGGFVGLFNSALRDIDVDVVPPLPPYMWRDVRDDRRYALPVIGEVNEVAVEHIRAVAYVPIEEISLENVYSAETSEANDLDLVTVEVKFDVKGLYERFYESFAGVDVNEEWRDPCLAKPVFAALQLQRQDLGADGSWSDWQIVPRSKIDTRWRTLEVIEEVEDLPPGGIKVRLLQFDESSMRRAISQPTAYQIASAKEEWLPPSLHKTFVTLRRDVEAQKKRQEREAEREERGRGVKEVLAERRRMSTGFFGGGEEEYGETGEFSEGIFSGRGTRRSRSARARAARTGEEEEYGEYGSDRRRIGSREGSKPRSIGEVYSRFRGLLITPETNFAKMREPLVCWAHDDTCQPEKSYRYRVRLGVFNPVAGTGQVTEQYESQKDKVILWSKFSEVTETVEIPGKFYFFPIDIQEAAKKTKVQVCKYVLGHWYSEAFTVEPGEVIGKVVETEMLEKRGEEGWDESVEIMIPETVDYSTGAVLVDFIPVNDWLGTKYLRPRRYFSMLYSFDGTSIEHMPIRSTYWAKESLVTFAEINRAAKEPMEPWRGWGSSLAESAEFEFASEWEEWADEDDEEYEDEDYEEDW